MPKPLPVATLRPIYDRAKRKARHRTDARGLALREFAADLRVLAALPPIGPQMLGLLDHPAETREDWLRAARSVAARYNVNLELREQMSLFQRVAS